MKYLLQMLILVSIFAVFAACGATTSAPQEASARPGLFPRLENVRGPFPGELSGDIVGDKPLAIEFLMVGDQALYEGDINLPRAVLRSGEAGSAGIGAVWSFARWPKGVVPYLIQPGLDSKSSVLAAIAHWQEKTPIRFVERTTETDYVYFQARRDTLPICTSDVGRSGGAQTIDLAWMCDTGSIIHEIGHAVGLMHEQHRSDRDKFITIFWENIDPAYHSQFTSLGSYYADYGAYDYDSVMHYYSTAFSINGKPSMLKKDGSMIGDASVLSKGDVETVLEMYKGFIPLPQLTAAELQTKAVLAAANKQLSKCVLEASSVGAYGERGSLAIQLRATHPDGTKTSAAEFFINQDFSDDANAAVILAPIPKYFFSACG